VLIRFFYELMDYPVLIKEYGCANGDDQDSAGEGDVKKNPSEQFHLKITVFTKIAAKTTPNRQIDIHPSKF